MFPYPNCLKNHHFWEGISALCCATNNMFCRLSGKWPTLEALFNITSAFACILKQIFIFSVLILPLFLGKFVDRHFYLRLHSGCNFHVSALGFVTPLEKLCLMSFASRMHFGSNFHVLAVDLVIITEIALRFGAKHSTTPSRNECLMMIAYNNRRLSIACSSSHIGAQTLVIKNCRAAVCPPLRAFN